MHKSKLMNEERQLLNYVFETGETVLCKRLEEAVKSGEAVKVDIVATEAAMDTILYFMFGNASMKGKYNPDTVRQAAKDTLAYMLASLTPGCFGILQHIPGTQAHTVLQKRNAAWKVFDELIGHELQIMIQEARGDRQSCEDRKPGSILEQWLLSEPKFSQRGIEPIMAECRGMILAGFETTAHAIAYAFGMMAENPSLSKKLHDVSVKALQHDMKTTILSESGFVKNFFLEALCLYPLTPALGGVETDDFVAKDGKGNEYGFAKGTNFLFFNGVMQRDEDYCGASPSDVIPDRWASPQPTDHPFLNVFNTGPHACPGKPLALLEGRVFLLQAAARFDFSFPEGVDKVCCDEQMLLRPKDAMPLYVRKRLL